jgi:hypothetical protein
MDPRSHIPFNFIFKGPPGESLYYRSLLRARLITDLGTGKTTTTQKMGQVFYDMGLLSTPEYLERSALDLVAPYVGPNRIENGKCSERWFGEGPLRG